MNDVWRDVQSSPDWKDKTLAAIRWGWVATKNVTIVLLAVLVLVAIGGPKTVKLSYQDDLFIKRYLLLDFVDTNESLVATNCNNHTGTSHRYAITSGLVIHCLPPAAARQARMRLEGHEESEIILEPRARYQGSLTGIFKDSERAGILLSSGQIRAVDAFFTQTGIANASGFQYTLLQARSFVKHKSVEPWKIIPPGFVAIVVAVGVITLTYEIFERYKYRGCWVVAGLIFGVGLVGAVLLLLFVG